MNRLSLWVLACSCALITAFSGCRSITPPLSYYIISPLTDTSMPPADEGGNRAKIVGLNPIELPGYLNRIQMVKRTGANRLVVSSSNRWADYPDRLIQRVLGDNLQLLMADARVYSAPWPAGIKPDVTVDIAFHELIGTADKTMLLSAVWTISAEHGPSAPHRTTLSQSITGSGFDDLAAAHSRVLEALCQEVADALSGFPAH